MCRLEEQTITRLDFAKSNHSLPISCQRHYTTSKVHGKILQDSQSKAFKQSSGLLHKRNCDPLNLSIIRKNFTKNIFRRNFRPENITACQSLLQDFVIDYSPLLDFFRRRIWTNVPSFSDHNKVLVFSTWLTGFQRSMSNFSSDSLTLLRKFPYVCSLLAKTVPKTSLTSKSGWTIDSSL